MQSGIDTPVCCNQTDFAVLIQTLMTGGLPAIKPTKIEQVVPVHVLQAGEG